MASEMGRGAQVRLDGLARQKARGGGGTLIGNIREARDLTTGISSQDGSLLGVPAEDEVLTPGGVFYEYTVPLEAFGIVDRTGTLDMAPLINAAIVATAAAGEELRIGPGTYRLNSSVFVRSGMRLVASPRARFIGYFDTVGARAMVCLTDADAAIQFTTPLTDIYIEGGSWGRNGTRPTPTTWSGNVGNVFSFYGVRVTLIAVEVKNYSSGRAFFIGGEHWRLDRCRALDTPIQGGTGAFRWYAGGPMLATNLFAECGDDCFQVVPGNFATTDCHDITYSDCYGISTAARVCVIGLGVRASAGAAAQDTANLSVKRVTFRNITGFSPFPVGIGNTDNIQPIEDVVFEACSFECTAVMGGIGAPLSYVLDFTGATATPPVGGVVTGGTSGAVATIVSVTGTTAGSMVFTVAPSFTFQNGETLTFPGGTATASGPSSPGLTGNIAINLGGADLGYRLDYTAPSATPVVGTVCTGAMSSAVATVARVYADETFLIFRSIAGAFVNGEALSFSDGKTATADGPSFENGAAINRITFRDCSLTRVLGGGVRVSGDGMGEVLLENWSQAAPQTVNTIRVPIAVQDCERFTMLGGSVSGRADGVFQLIFVGSASAVTFVQVTHIERVGFYNIPANQAAVFVSNLGGRRIEMTMCSIFKPQTGVTTALALRLASDTTCGLVTGNDFTGLAAVPVIDLGTNNDVRDNRP